MHANAELPFDALSLSALSSSVVFIAPMMYAVASDRPHMKGRAGDVNLLTPSCYPIFFFVTFL